MTLAEIIKTNLVTDKKFALLTNVSVDSGKAGQSNKFYSLFEQAEIHMNLNYSAKGSHEVVEELEVIEVDPIREIIMYYLIWAIFLLAVFTFSIAIGVVIATIKYA